MGRSLGGSEARTDRAFEPRIRVDRVYRLGALGGNIVDVMDTILIPGYDCRVRPVEQGCDKSRSIVVGYPLLLSRYSCLFA